MPLEWELMPEECPCCASKRLFSNGLLAFYDCGLSLWLCGNKIWLVDKQCGDAMEVAAELKLKGELLERQKQNFSQPVMASP
jgi:hypothetical protein